MYVYSENLHTVHVTHTICMYVYSENLHTLCMLICKCLYCEDLHIPYMHILSYYLNS